MAALLVGCGGDALGPDEVARVGDVTITVDEFEHEMNRLGGNMPGRFQTVDQRRELLAAMILEERLLQAALKQGLDEDPEVRRAYRKMLIGRLQDQLLEDRLSSIEVTDEEVRRYYEANAERYERPERRRAAIIFASGSDEEAIRKRLQSVREKAAALTDVTHFGHLALEYSEDQASRYVGGSIGWLSSDVPERYKWGIEVVDALFALENPGDVSDVVETDDGYYLVRLMSVDSGGERDYEQLESGIRRALTVEQQRRVRESLLDEFTGGAEVVINQQAVAEADPPNPARVADRNRPPALPDNG